MLLVGETDGGMPNKNGVVAYVCLQVDVCVSGFLLLHWVRSSMCLCQATIPFVLSCLPLMRGADLETANLPDQLVW